MMVGTRYGLGASGLPEGKPAWQRRARAMERDEASIIGVDAINVLCPAVAAALGTHASCNESQKDRNRFYYPGVVA